MNARFDDALGLMARDFRGVRAIFLCGESGSGKSSAIRFLIHQHPHISADPSIRVIEELRRWRDLYAVHQSLRAGRRLLVASHLPPRLHRLLGAFTRNVVIDLDRHPAKISRWLAARGIAHSEAAVSSFCDQFGANYSDADLILRHSNASSFDQALRRFLRDCRLQRGRLPNGLPVLTMDAATAETHYQTMNATTGKCVPG